MALRRHGARRLKTAFGDQIVFHGGMDNQQTLPFGTVADVRQEVRENIEILGQERRLYLGCRATISRSLRRRRTW
ncbi:MAG: hypothetical protein R2911_45120 [Caldilineaceae bacterium]